MSDTLDSSGTSEEPQTFTWDVSQGPRPFVTRRLHRKRDGAIQVWSSRHHRKHLPAPETLLVGMVRRAFREGWLLFRDWNWWIGLSFAVGSLLFIVGSVLTFLPPAEKSQLPPPEAIFFWGSWPFTIAASMQFIQAILATPCPGVVGYKSRRLLGFWVSNLGWWSCFFQWIGTLLFNLCTFNGLSSDWSHAGLLLWVALPNLMGSVLFFLSGYLAFAETCHAYWRWSFWNLSWWVVWINGLGCLGFLISACLVFPIDGEPPALCVALSNGFTLGGAVCFFAGALLSMPEAATGPVVGVREASGVDPTLL